MLNKFYKQLTTLQCSRIVQKYPDDVCGHNNVPNRDALLCQTDGAVGFAGQILLAVFVSGAKTLCPLSMALASYYRFEANDH